MLNYVKENFGNRPSANEQDRMELEVLRQKVAQLRKEIGGNKGLSTGESAQGDSESDSEDG